MAIANQRCGWCLIILFNNKNNYNAPFFLYIWTTQDIFHSSGSSLHPSTCWFSSPSSIFWSVDFAHKRRYRPAATSAAARILEAAEALSTVKWDQTGRRDSTEPSKVGGAAQDEHVEEEREDHQQRGECRREDGAFPVYAPDSSKEWQPRNKDSLRTWSLGVCKKKKKKTKYAGSVLTPCRMATSCKLPFRWIFHAEASLSMKAATVTVWMVPHTAIMADKLRSAGYLKAMLSCASIAELQ